MAVDADRNRPGLGESDSEGGGEPHTEHWVAWLAFSIWQRPHRQWRIGRAALASSWVAAARQVLHIEHDSALGSLAVVHAAQTHGEPPAPAPAPPAPEPAPVPLDAVGWPVPACSTTTSSVLSTAPVTGLGAAG